MTSEEFFSTIQLQYGNTRPFVAFRRPNTSVIKTMLQKDDSLNIVSDYKEMGFVFAPFDDNIATILIPIDKSEVIEIDGIESSPFDFASKVVDSFLGSKEEHIKLVKKGIDAIEISHFQKVVLSRKEIVSNSATNPIEIFRRLLNVYPSAFVYCWYHPKVGLWLGATPETLLNLKGNHFSTMALAGTQVYHGTLKVKWTEKELKEQQIVTDYLMSNLKSYITDLKCSEKHTIKAGNLLHIQTMISGTLNSKIEQVLRMLHPTPAVCGVPKIEAKQFIMENENYDREFYTGFLGELNSNQSELYVNLRCIQLVKDKALLYVGGGITKDSNPENEWEETLNKAKIIKRVL